MTIPDSYRRHLTLSCQKKVKVDRLTPKNCFHSPFSCCLIFSPPETPVHPPFGQPDLCGSSRLRVTLLRAKGQDFKHASIQSTFGEVKGSHIIFRCDLSPHRSLGRATARLKLESQSESWRQYWPAIFRTMGQSCGSWRSFAVSYNEISQNGMPFLLRVISTAPSTPSVAWHRPRRLTVQSSDSPVSFPITPSRTL